MDNIYTDVESYKIVIQFPERASDYNWSNKFANWEVVKILTIHPHLSTYCMSSRWTCFDGYDWTGLLAHQPQFADKCNWSELSGFNWAFLLSHQPQFAEYCRWEKLNESNWDFIYKNQISLQKFIKEHKDQYLLMREMDYKTS